MLEEVFSPKEVRRVKSRRRSPKQYIHYYVEASQDDAMFESRDEGCEQVAKVSHECWGVIRSAGETESVTGEQCHELERRFIFLK